MLVLKCSKCQHRNPTKAKFCGKCGVDLSDGKIVEIVGIGENLSSGIAFWSFGILISALMMAPFIWVITFAETTEGDNSAILFLPGAVGLVISILGLLAAIRGRRGNK